MIKNRQKGIALIFALAVMVILSVVLAANFLGMARSQRSVQRSVHRIELETAARSVIDYGHKFFADYVRTFGKYPTLNESREVEAVDDGELLSARMSAWFADLKNAATHPTEAAILSGLTLDSVSVKFVEGEEHPGAEPPEAADDDMWRRYEAKIKITDAATKAEYYGKQTFKISSGGLLDFMTFFDGDLEIAPGPSTTIQGPLFSNSNIYLMTNAASTLSLQAPPDTVAENYTLRAAKNIYYYFKRAVGRNYFLHNPGSAGSQPYYEAVVNKIAAARGGSGQFAQDDPFPGYGEENGLEIFPVPFRKWDGTNYVNASYGEDTTFARKYIPYFYYFENGSVHGNGSVIKLVNSGGSLVDTLAGPYCALVYPRALIESYWHYVQPPVTPANGSKAWTSLYDDVTSMSMSTAWDITKMPAPEDDWSYEAPNENITNAEPLSKGWKYTTDLDKPVSVGITKRFLPTGLPAGSTDPNPNHILIEPIDAVNDPAELKQLKFESRADILLKCSNSDCTGYYNLTLKNGDPNWSGFAWDMWDRGYYGVSNFYDYRLGENVAALNLNMGGLNEVINEYAGNNGGSFEGVDPGHDGIVIYIEIKPITASGWTTSTPRSVRLINGGKGPVTSWDGKVKGFTVVTNGRLWIQGDFNTWEYTDPDDLSQGAYVAFEDQKAHPENHKIPPAVIMSDSLGVLSSNWNDSWDGSTLPTDRVAYAATNIYAGLVTGYLYSQLDPLYPGCLDHDIAANTDPDFEPGSKDACWPMPNPDHSSHVPYYYHNFIGWHSLLYTLPSTIKLDSDLAYVVSLTGVGDSQYYTTASARPDNKWPAWAATGEDLPLHIAGPSDAVSGNTQIHNTNYIPDPALYLPASLRGSTRPAVNVPMFPGIKMAELVKQDIFGEFMMTCRCPGYYKYSTSYTVLGGEATGDSVSYAGRCTRTLDASDNYHIYQCTGTACPNHGMSGANPVAPITGLPCGKTKYNENPSSPTYDANYDYHIDGDGFLAPNSAVTVPNGVAVSFDRGYGMNLDEGGDFLQHYQVKWNSFGWKVHDSGVYKETCNWPDVSPGCTASQYPLYPNALVYTVKNNDGNSSANNEARFYPWIGSGDSTHYETRSNWIVVKNPATGNYYFIWDNIPYAPKTAGGVSCPVTIANHITTVTGVDTGSGTSNGEPVGCPVLEPLLRPNTSPMINYTGWYYQPLYKARYSGGLENIINLQEWWRDKTFNLSGVLTSPWQAEELIKQDGVSKAFYDTSYYSAPTRNFDYNETFLTDTAPGLLGLKAVAREKYEEITGE